MKRSWLWLCESLLPYIFSGGSFGNIHVVSGLLYSPLFGFVHICFCFNISSHFRRSSPNLLRNDVIGCFWHQYPFNRFTWGLLSQRGDLHVYLTTGLDPHYVKPEWIITTFSNKVESGDTKNHQINNYGSCRRVGSIESKFPNIFFWCNILKL